MLAPLRPRPGASPTLHLQRRYKSTTPQTRDEFRSLLRKLLREASYLPDATARSYFAARITAQFRAYQPPQTSSQPNERPVKRIWNAAKLLRRPGKVEELRVQAHDTLSLLTQANAGKFQDVDRVLSLAYGRTGPLREKLLQPYLLPDEPRDDAALRSSIPAHGTSKAKPTSPANDIGFSSALIALAKAQIAHRDQLQKSDVMRHLYYAIPKENMWGRPMPLRRLRNLKQRMYLKVTTKVLPPLPVAQWERLQRLCTGEERWAGRTRSMPASKSYELPTTSRRVSARPAKPPFKRKIDHRFMQRRYRTLFGQSPCITWHSEKKKWVVEYGTPSPSHIPAASSSMLSLFGIQPSISYSRPSKRKSTKSREAS